MHNILFLPAREGQEEGRPFLPFWLDAIFKCFRAIPRICYWIAGLVRSISARQKGAIELLTMLHAVEKET